MEEGFFTLYQDLDREGPGEREDVEWVAGLLELPDNASVCDAGCGSGGDVPTFLDIFPDCRVTAVDTHKPFIDELLVRIDADPRVTAYAGSMAKLKGPFDLIWSAGAVYFLGVENCLTAWRPALAKGGAVAFSHPCHFVETPSDAAAAFWEDCFVTDAAGIDSQVRNAGFRTVATRRVSESAWDAYFRPLQARIAALRSNANVTLSEVLDASQNEIDVWTRVKDETGYLLSVVRPV